MVTINTASQDEIQQILSELEQALCNHQQWYNSIIRALICRIPGNETDRLPDAHKRCRFGQWFYDDSTIDCSRLPGASSIEESHRRMHQLASRLLQDSMTPNGIVPLDYDHFANALEQLRSELFAVKDELEYTLHNRDPLTGALIRESLLPTLHEQQKISKRHDQNSCLILFNLDDFKKYDELYGHQTADRSLAAVARFFIENLRPYDKLFRYGKEEFLILLPFTELKVGKKIIERLRKRLISIPLKSNDGGDFHITASFGMTLLKASYPIEASIRVAEAALNKAKTDKKHGLVVLENPPSGSVDSLPFSTIAHE